MRAVHRLRLRLRLYSRAPLDAADGPAFWLRSPVTIESETGLLARTMRTLHRVCMFERAALSRVVLQAGRAHLAAASPRGGG